MCHALLFKIASIWEYPATGAWIKKMWHMCLKEKFSTHERSKIMAFSGTCVQLETILLCEIGHPGRLICRIYIQNWTCMCVQTFIFTNQTSTVQETQEWSNKTVLTIHRTDMNKHTWSPHTTHMPLLCSWRNTLRLVFSVLKLSTLLLYFGATIKKAQEVT